MDKKEWFADSEMLLRVMAGYAKEHGDKVYKAEDLIYIADKIKMKGV